jgi:formate dehydrogenase major subunit
MTNGWIDVKNSDVILAMGGNPAENHPCGFKWVMEAKKNRTARLVCIDPRFNRTAAVSDCFVQIRAGTDIAFLGGLINYTLSNGLYHEEYVRLFTNGPFLVKHNFSFSNGLFSGFNPATHAYDKTSWQYEQDERGYAMQDPTMQDPRCVLQLLKQHYERYTPEVVSQITGAPVKDFLKAAEIICSTGRPDRAGTIMYALGWTHHSFAVQIIRAAAILQLLLGNIGRPGGGLNALRGHSNIQGGTDHGMAYDKLPGYLKLPTISQPTLRDHLRENTPRPLTRTAINYWENYPKFFISLLKCMFASHANKENDFCYHYLPKIERDYSWVNMFDDMYQGRLEGMLCFGMNPVANGPHSNKMIAALSKLKWLVVAECFETETAQFWKAPGIDPTTIKTEVFLLPAANFAEKDGSFTNSARWAQWKWKALDPPGEAKADQEILSSIFQRVRGLYQQGGGAFPEPILHLHWPYSYATNPPLEEIAREINGRAVEDLKDEKGEVIIRKGQQLPSFAQLKDDGSTACGNWIYCGSFTEEGNLMARRGLKDPNGLGMFPEWTWSWPANRRVMYNRASSDAKGRPWDPTRAGIEWNGLQWVGDTPDYKPNSPPEAGLGPFLMLPEGVGKLFAPDFAEGPFPEHYEPVESPVKNVLHPGVSSNPLAKTFKSAMDRYASPEEYPIVCTTYRLTEHFHYWTKHITVNSELQPEFFVEIPEGLAGELGIKNQQMIRVTSPRGSVEGKALVTRRIRPMEVNGKRVWQIGIPIHWGFAGRVTGPLANFLTPTALDPNCSTPEYKGFLVRVERV